MPSNSPLLNLPAELRLDIYSYLWTPLPVRAARCRLSPTLKIRPELLAPHRLAILQTCRLIYTEAYKLAFKRHTFILDGRHGAVKVPDADFARNSPLAFVRKIAIVCTDIEPHYPQNLPPQCSNIRIIRTRRGRNTITLHAPPDPPFYEYERWERFQSICRLVRVLSSLQRVIFLEHKPGERNPLHYTQWLSRRSGKDGRVHAVPGYMVSIKMENMMRFWTLWVAYDEAKKASRCRKEEKKKVWVYIVGVQEKNEEEQKEEGGQ